MSEEKRIGGLIDGYCSGCLSEAEFGELEDVLRRSPEWRRRLIEARSLDADLRGLVSGLPELVREDIAPPVGRHRLARLNWRVGALAASFLIPALALALITGRVLSGRSLVDPGIAVLTRSIDAEWRGQGWHPGDAVAPGRLMLERGTAELEFYSGAAVILAAPAELELVSEDRVHLREGKLRAEVPPQARGFTVVTPEIKLVDLGTSFGIEVEEGRRTGIHVFDGEVELYRADGVTAETKAESLSAGDAREFGADGGSRRIDADEGRFLSRSDFDRMAVERREQRFRQWREFSAGLSQEPEVIVSYPFQTDSLSARTLRNESPHGAGWGDGSIIGATWTSGRWPGKTALDFKRPSDRVRIQIPGNRDSLTLIAWIRIDGFDNKHSSLLLSDGWARPGAMHWQIRSDSTIGFSVSRGRGAGKRDFVAPFVMTPVDFGRWTQVALVYDSGSREVTHYRDGIVSGRSSADSWIPLEIGAAEIGNWTPPNRRKREVRNFNGRIDELVIFGEALASDEIRAHFEVGRP